MLAPAAALACEVLPAKGKPPFWAARVCLRKKKVKFLLKLFTKSLQGVGRRPTVLHAVERLVAPKDGFLMINGRGGRFLPSFFCA